MGGGVGVTWSGAVGSDPFSQPSEGAPCKRFVCGVRVLAVRPLSGGVMEHDAVPTDFPFARAHGLERFLQCFAKAGAGFDACSQVWTG
jgi:hypothetical protein